MVNKIIYLHIKLLIEFHLEFCIVNHESSTTRGYAQRSCQQLVITRFS